MKQSPTKRFDALVADAIDSLPPALRRMIDQTPVIVLDRPTPQMLREIGARPDEADDLCGLHTGTAITERGIEDHGRLPTAIHLFRCGIVALAGGWDGADSDERVYEEIRVTLLHELGHEHGLDEGDLADLGYD
ncbi:MAG: metallopeptidase family protein [Phycisphaerales bacterium]|nr:metallopeptidase family protein [Phycisphaerales bacterium]